MSISKEESSAIVQEVVQAVAKAVSPALDQISPRGEDGKRQHTVIAAIRQEIEGLRESVELAAEGVVSATEGEAEVHKALDNMEARLAEIEKQVRSLTLATKGLLDAANPAGAKAKAETPPAPEYDMGKEFGEEPAPAAPAVKAKKAKAPTTEAPTDDVTSVLAQLSMHGLTDAI